MPLKPTHNLLVRGRIPAGAPIAFKKGGISDVFPQAHETQPSPTVGFIPRMDFLLEAINTNLDVFAGPENDCEFPH